PDQRDRLAVDRRGHRAPDRQRRRKRQSRRRHRHAERPDELVDRAHRDDLIAHECCVRSHQLSASGVPLMAAGPFEETVRAPSAEIETVAALSWSWPSASSEMLVPWILIV